MTLRHGALVRFARSGGAILVIARRLRVAFVVAASLVSSACYTYTAQSIETGLVEKSAEFRISDVGRVSLVEQLGPGALTVEGQVVSQNAEGWALNVFRLTTIRGEAYTWMGERIELPRSSVESVAGRTFDRQRTFATLALVGGAVAAFVITRSLLAGGLLNDDPPPTGPPVSIRY